MSYKKYSDLAEKEVKDYGNIVDLIDTEHKKQLGIVAFVVKKNSTNSTCYLLHIFKHL